MKNYIEIKNKNLKLGLIWLGISINVAFFIWFFISGNLDPAPRFQAMNHGWRFFTTLTFWTTQVCAMNIIFPILVVLNGKCGIWKPTYQSWISFIAFNLMCMIIFWAGFTDFDVSSIQEQTPVGDISAYANVIFSKPAKLIITLWAHMFGPIASILVFIFFVKKYKLDVKTFYKSASPFCIAYLSAWFLINIVKMFVMYGVGVDNIITFEIPGDYNTAFEEFYQRIRGDNPGFWQDMSVIGYLSGPYFFFNFALDQDIASNGPSLMMGVAFGSVIITLVMQYTTLCLANLWVKKKDPDTIVITKPNLVSEKYNGKKFEIVKIFFYLTTIIAGIYQLTQTSHYINEEIGLMYKAAYLAVALTILIGSIIGIIVSFLYIFNIYNNPSWTFFISLSVGGFAISFFLIGIPLLIISVFAIWYKSNKKISN